MLVGHRSIPLTRPAVWVCCYLLVLNQNITLYGVATPLPGLSVVLLVSRRSCVQGMTCWVRAPNEAWVLPAVLCHLLLGCICLTVNTAIAGNSNMLLHCVYTERNPCFKSRFLALTYCIRLPARQKCTQSQPFIFKICPNSPGAVFIPTTPHTHDKTIEQFVCQ